MCYRHFKFSFSTNWSSHQTPFLLLLQYIYIFLVSCTTVYSFPQTRSLETPPNMFGFPMTGRRQWHPTPVLLPGKSHGWRSLVGCSPWGHTESDTTEQLHFHFSLSCIGEGNGNPLQCSCLEDPRDRGAWWAAVYGVAQSQTWLGRLSSSSSSSNDSQILRIPPVHVSTSTIIGLVKE